MTTVFTTDLFEGANAIAFSSRLELVNSNEQKRVLLYPPTYMEGTYKSKHVISRPDQNGNESTLVSVLRDYLEQHDCAPEYEVPKKGEDLLHSEFGPALYVERKDGIEKTVFNRVAGSDNVINLARKARKEILKNTAKSKSTDDSLAEALYGPWLENDGISTFGWNPADKKEAASLAGSKVPKSMKHRTVVAVNWLAFESLPLLAPIALVSNKNEWNYSLPNRASYHEASALMYGFSNLKEVDLKAMGISVYYSRAEFYSQSASCFVPSIRVA